MKKMKQGPGGRTCRYGSLLMIASLFILGSCGGRKGSDGDHPLVTAALQFNASCPRMIDMDTRLDSGFFIPDSTFQFDYTLLNYDSNQVDAAALALYLKPRIRSNVRVNPEMKVQRDHQVTMVFHYRDRNGNFVTRIHLTPEEY